MLSVIVGVMLAGFRRVMFGMALMTMCDVRVVPGLFVVVCGVVFRRGAMMLRRVLVMFGSLQVMVGDFFRHGIPFVEL